MGALPLVLENGPLIVLIPRPDGYVATLQLFPKLLDPTCLRLATGSTKEAETMADERLLHIATHIF